MQSEASRTNSIVDFHINVNKMVGKSEHSIGHSDLIFAKLLYMTRVFLERDRSLSDAL